MSQTSIESVDIKLTNEVGKKKTKMALDNKEQL